jgi:D-galactarolactone isomerase
VGADRPRAGAARREFATVAIMNTTPTLKIPPKSCDTHMHVYDDRYPLDPGWHAPPPNATTADYLKVQHQLGLERVVVVQPNAYGYDNDCTTDAIRDLGSQARGIAIVKPDVSDGELKRLHDAGIRGARCYVLPNPFVQWDDVPRIAARVAPLGWHVQIQLDGRTLPQYDALIRALPTDFVIDHNGKFMEPVPPSDPAFQMLLRLLDTGRCWVKLSSPYETSKTGAPKYEDVSALARALARRNPERCVWATNWPHPGRNPPPENGDILDLLQDWVPDEATRHRILVDNPARLYGF